MISESTTVVGLEGGGRPPDIIPTDGRKGGRGHLPLPLPVPPDVQYC